jgi:DNA repair protein RadC
MTRALAEACHVVGIPLLDHVIVARGGASSLLEVGALEPSPGLR